MTHSLSSSVSRALYRTRHVRDRRLFRVEYGRGARRHDAGLDRLNQHRRDDDHHHDRERDVAVRLPLPVQALQRPRRTPLRLGHDRAHHQENDPIETAVDFDGEIEEYETVDFTPSLGDEHYRIDVSIEGGTGDGTYLFDYSYGEATIVTPDEISYTLVEF